MEAQQPGRVSAISKEVEDYEGFLSFLLDGPKSLVVRVIEVLKSSGHVCALILHGSPTRGTADALSDVDLIAVVNPGAVPAIDREVDLGLRPYTPSYDIVESIYPWFGRLRSLHWIEPWSLQLDLGFVSRADFSDFFVEPSAIILREDAGEATLRKQECIKEKIPILRSKAVEVEARTYALLVKIRKSLSRGHLWNSLEAVSQIRRLLFGILILEYDDEAHLFVGRTDRSIERIIPTSLKSILEASAPSYSAESIVSCLNVIMKQLVESENAYGHWRNLGLIKDYLAKINVEFGGAPKDESI